MCASKDKQNSQRCSFIWYRVANQWMSMDIHVSVRYNVDLLRQEKAQIWLLIPISDNHKKVNALMHNVTTNSYTKHTNASIP